MTVKSAVPAVLLAAGIGLSGPLVVVRVTDAETGRLLERATVTVDRVDLIATTGADGTCLVPARLPRRGSLTAAAAGFLQAQADVRTGRRVSDSVVFELSVYPDRPRGLRGTVTDSMTGQPLPEAHILVVGTGESTVARTDGEFLFLQFPAGKHSLEVSYPGYVARDLEVAVGGGETAFVHVRLVDTSNVGDLKGTVVDAGTGLPVAGAQLSVDPTAAGAATDSCGAYLIPGLPSGVYQVSVSCPGYASRTIRFRVLRGWAVSVDFDLVPDTGVK